MKMWTDEFLSTAAEINFNMYYRLRVHRHGKPDAQKIKEV